MSRRNRDATQEPHADESKSARKRSAHAAQALGEALIGLPDAQLAELELPEALLDAIRLARRITSRAGGARQRQFIGRLMRDVDTAPIQAALAARSERTARAAEQFRRVESWRERLIAEGEAALDELERWRPGLERAALTRQLRAAQAERASRGANGPAGRALFRALQALFQ